MPSEFRNPDWDFPGIEHGFGSCDAPVAEHLRLVRVKQIHGAEIVIADAQTPAEAGEADGLLTRAPGHAVAVATADCVPVLLVAPEERAVAAIHAGWRGTLAAIVPNAVRALERNAGAPAKEIHAALGPSIGSCCFEIEREIAERFAQAFGDLVWDAWSDGRPGKGTLDLRAVNADLLQRSGVPPEQIRHVGPCTACGDADLASYRARGPKAGRQLSWVGLSA